MTSPAKVSRLEADIEAATDSVRSLEVERDAARTELDSTRTGLERTKKHVGVLQERVEQLRKESAGLKIKLGLAPEAAG